MGQLSDLLCQSQQLIPFLGFRFNHRFIGILFGSDKTLESADRVPHQRNVLRDAGARSAWLAASPIPSVRCSEKAYSRGR